MSDNHKVIGALAGILLLINIIIFIGMVCLSFHLMAMIGLNGYGRVFASLAVTFTLFNSFNGLTKLAKTE